jgi:mRNA-degrading endonuclease toxin of MazEF toxin-antitoxin module
MNSRAVFVANFAASGGILAGQSATVHTTALRGTRWELSIPKPFLKPGAFHLQQVQTISTVKLERKLGAPTAEEMKRVTGRVGRTVGDLRRVRKPTGLSHRTKWTIRNSVGADSRT